MLIQSLKLTQMQLNSFEVIVVGYVICVTMFLLNMTSVNDCPDPSIVPEDMWMPEDSERAATLNKVSRQVIEEYDSLDFHFDVDSKCDLSTAYDYTCK